MADTILGLAVGFISGLLSGQFGIGGGLITTPAIRLLLDQPALVAVGTPLPVMIPSAVVGALSYSRSGLADVRGGLTVGAVGAVASVGGAMAASRIGGSALLVVTAVIIGYLAVDMAVAAFRGREKGPGGRVEPYSETPATPPDDGVREEPEPPPPTSRLVVLGLLAGTYSGLLGLGGGFVIVPLLERWMRYPLKRAIGTSLVAISVMAIPGSITHWLLGNVDLEVAALLIVGVVPGALLGARVTRAAREFVVRIGFSALLFVVATILLLSEGGRL